MEKLQNLDPEKRERIINAAMAEFASKGFEQASTNEIVKGAGISKGLLFHYFKNKKQLYLYVYDYCINVCMDDFYTKIDHAEKDFFRMVRNVMRAKLVLLKKYPELFNFLREAYLETACEVKDEIASYNMKLLDLSMAKIFSGIDTTKFAEGMDLYRALSIIQWTSEGMAADELKRCRILRCEVDYEKLFEQVESYLAIFEKLFYKGGQ